MEIMVLGTVAEATPLMPDRNRDKTQLQGQAPIDLLSLRLHLLKFHNLTKKSCQALNIWVSEGYICIQTLAKNSKL